jgi:hypothetical protein
MAQVKPVWEQVTEFNAMAVQLVEKYPERFGSIDVEQIVAYKCTNKERPEKKAKSYEMTGSSEPESFTNSKMYFVKMFSEDWEIRTESQKLALVCSALSRIDADSPGKVGPLDYRDQNIMVRTFGTDWQDRADIPHLLRDSVSWRE